MPYMMQLYTTYVYNVSFGGVSGDDYGEQGYWYRVFTGYNDTMDDFIDWVSPELYILELYIMQFF